MCLRRLVPCGTKEPQETPVQRRLTCPRPGLPPARRPSAMAHRGQRLPRGLGRAGQGRHGSPRAAGRCWLLWAQGQAGAFSRLPPPAQPLRPSRGWVATQELPRGSTPALAIHRPCASHPARPCADSAAPMCQLNENFKSLLDPFFKSSVCFWGRGKNPQKRQHTTCSIL